MGLVRRSGAVVHVAFASRVSVTVKMGGVAQTVRFSTVTITVTAGVCAETVLLLKSKQQRQQYPKLKSLLFQSGYVSATGGGRDQRVLYK